MPITGGVADWLLAYMDRKQHSAELQQVLRNENDKKLWYKESSIIRQKIRRLTKLVVLISYFAVLMFYFYGRCEKNRKEVNRADNKLYDNMIFIYSVYLINQTSIRAVLVRQCDALDQLSIILSWGDKAQYSAPLVHQSIDYCPWTYSPKT
ncbi:unnamed protein product [Gongylonema pulchrum]|uniref:G_PROTEIN_RECEP_F1_2 domain-containing protein n=1 Tax=Gongylonema pulchrum TaxID=637853 RepID=A0A183CUH5_9BILA|nr:unnamed protein product [Gongylonema pulchrum]